MIRTAITFYFILIVFLTFGQGKLEREIKEMQLERFDDEICLDFVRGRDFSGIDEKSIQQIIIIRHGEPAMNKKGWRNRDEAIRYTRMYDSVGVYDFEQEPICLRENDVDTVFTSLLPRAIDTAEKTFQGSVPLNSMRLFNEFERKIIKFPNVKLPGKFWSITSRAVWVIGFNRRGIESFSDAKSRSRAAARFLDKKSGKNGKALLFSHGFLNKYIKRYLKKMGYRSVSLNGQKYLGAYYFYKIKDKNEN
ncbi:MAG: histidine phosphatase family protein [Cytophagales bacterium]|nr:histidine phosphatase family protein [Cytophagales bacterium]